MNKPLIIKVDIYLDDNVYIATSKEVPNLNIKSERLIQLAQQVRNSIAYLLNYQHNKFLVNYSYL